MNGLFQQEAKRFAADQSGQALPFIALALVALLGMSGIAVDVGRCLLFHRQLQAATDAAALAGAATLPSTSATTAAINYSSVSGSLNARPSLSGSTMVSGYPKAVCLATLQNQGIACSSPANANAVQVREQLAVNMYFLKLVGVKTLTIGAVSTSAMRGAGPTPYNVAIIIDSTLSMQEQDSNCNATQMACALNGVQILLQALYPCASSQKTCTINNGVATNSVDRVALFTFPAISPSTVSIETCTTPISPSNTSPSNYYYASPYGYFNILNQQPSSTLATSTPYTYPTAGASSYSPGSSGTYQITGFLSDYKTSDTATSLNPNSILVKAAGAGGNNCGGLWPPNFEADYQTYYAGAIYAAQSALVAQQNANPGSQNVIIILSDGDANAAQSTNYGNGVTVVGMPSPATNSGNYPSYVNECLQGYYAANAATSAGTRVYTVAYGSPTGGCSTDQSSYYGVQVSACAAMEYMASAPQYFYSDYNQSGSNSNCVSSAQPVTSLSGIFASIAADLTVARLIPDNTT